MPRNNELPSYESLLEYQEVYLRAVALAWSDPEFKKNFLADPRTAMENYFGYSCPWNVTIRVTEPTDPKYHWTPAKDGQPGKWTLPRMKATFGLPDTPYKPGTPEKPDIKQQLIAFAAYNDAGPTYLFTCC